jgi:zinc protease
MIDILYRRFELANGLTLIVHEDRKAPIAAVNVWYHVGSKNEPPGKTGFAHLFEHLMFNGSEHYNDDFFKPFAEIGTTGQNGTTNEDRTNYFENVPRNALDLALWMESDRMGYMVGAIDQATLDEQRGVVQNEKRQGENQPYGRVWEHIAAATYPAGHPYAHTVIGSMDDLNAASLGDVKDWFKRYYGAANAVVSIAGDIDAETAKQKVEDYFGDVPPGPPVARFKAWTAKRSGRQREAITERVPAARIYKVWNIPGYASLAVDQLGMVGDVLSEGRSSRLYKRLVYDDGLASEVEAGVYAREIASQFFVVVTALPGKDIRALERAVDEELARFLKDGPSEVELERAKTLYEGDFIRGIERIGGFGGVSDILARAQVYTGNPDFYREQLARHRSATADELRATANAWLSDGDYTLVAEPFGEFKRAGHDVDRSQLPEVREFPEVEFPATERATLDNGLKLVFARRQTVPLVELTLLLDAGYAADHGAKPGTAKLAMEALTHGTHSRSAIEISDELMRLGADLDTDSTLDTSLVKITALKHNLDASLALFADVIMNPRFPDADVARLRNQLLAAIRRELQTPVQMALRVFPRLLYGEDHAYALPFTGSGYASTVAGLTRADLEAFHAAWFKPDHATLIVVGDTTLAEIKPKLNALLATWRPGSIPEKHLAEAALPRQSRVYLVDRPASEQSIIFAGSLAPPRDVPNDLALKAMNNILGGDFTARINMNLREDKHWAYGAYSMLLDAQGQRPFLAYAPVQTDQTAAAMAELQKEYEKIIGARPPAVNELQRAKNSATLSLPGRWETARAVAGALSEQIRFGLPDDYWDGYADKVNAVTLDEVAAAARQTVKPEQLTWIVVGDRALIESDIEKLGLGAIERIDADGE